MRKGIALLTAAGMLAGMVTPVFAGEQITTYRGDQEITLTEAGDIDITMEELVEKSRTVMQDSEDLAMFMVVDIDASISADMNGTPMSMDMVIAGDMSHTKKDGSEYSSEKMTMTFFGMNMDNVSEEYIFTNADGVKVSVKKESSTEPGEEGGEEAKWIAEIVDESGDEADTEDGAGDVSSFVSDDLYSSCELLDKMYTDGEKNYYVLKGNASEVMGNAFGDIEQLVGDVDVDAECYMLLAEDGMLESLYMDLGQVQGIVDEENGTETSFSSFLVAIYTEEPSEIVIPEEVQAAGDAAA